jgi:flagellar motor component MotA
MNRDEFIEQYNAFAKRALELAAKARREGILSLESDIDQQKVNERDIFEYGLSFALGGVDLPCIDKILSNIAAQEKDEQVYILKKMQIEAVLLIQQGMSHEILFHVLNSYTDIPLCEDKNRPEG